MSLIILIVQEHYQKAAILLEEASAAYPKKIGYNAPPHLSVEALEIHYRLHSCILKTLLAHEDRPMDPSLLQTLNKFLKSAADGLFNKGGRRNSMEEEHPEGGNKRKASAKHEDEKAAKKPAIEAPTAVSAEISAEAPVDVPVVVGS